MNKIIIRIISVILAAVTLSGISGGLRAQFLAAVTPVEDCKIIQGGCSDGEYIYAVVNDKKETDSKSAVLKYRLSDGKLIETYKNLQIDHGNDLCFNGNTNEIIAVSNAPDGRKITVLDADTMAVKRTVLLEEKIFSMAYSEEEDLYYAGISGGTDIAVFDSQFRLVKRLENCGGKGYTKQGMEVYEDYLLCLRHWSNCIEVYSKNGEFLKKVSLPVTLMAPEFICIANGECYIGYNLLSYTGGCIYKISEIDFLPDFEGC